jgi:repressor LexA
MSTFGERLRRLRQEHDKGLKEVAAWCGLSLSSIAKYEKGERTPNPDVVSKIAEKFDVSTDYLLGRDDSPRKTAIRHIPYASVPHITYRIPVLGRVAAGEPIYADEDIIGYERIDEKFANDGYDYFALRIAGQSMEPSILDGDTVIVRRQDFIEDGQIAVVLIDGEDATVKEVKTVSDGIMLIAHNPAVFSPRVFTKEEIESKPVQIIGRVIQSIRRF